MLLTNEDITRLFMVIDKHGLKHGDIERLSANCLAGGTGNVAPSIAKIAASLVGSLIHSGKVHPFDIKNHIATCAVGINVGIVLADLAQQERNGGKIASPDIQE